MNKNPFQISEFQGFQGVHTKRWNDPKQAETTRNKPKRPETTRNDPKQPETTRNDP